jgi:hypothetical protein
MSITIFFKLFLKIWAFNWTRSAPVARQPSPEPGSIPGRARQGRAAVRLLSYANGMDRTARMRRRLTTPPDPWRWLGRFSRVAARRPIQPEHPRFVQEVATAERDHASRGDSAVPRPASTAPDPTCWHEHRGFSAAWITL